MTEPTPAFYALRGGGWRDWVTLLHLPYTAWHLAYVVVGGCLAAEVAWGRLGLTFLAFALAMGVGAHALDELNGRPLRTRISSAALITAAVVSVAAACVIGVGVAVETTLWLLPAVAVGAFLVPAYNLEWLGGRVHTDLGFGLAWGAFPVAVSYLAQTGRVDAVTALAAAWATALSLAQRRLSTFVRRLRREVRDVDGALTFDDGRSEQLTREALLAPAEAALRLLTVSVLLVAGAVAATHLV